MLVYLSLGANLGNREETINKALDLLTEQVGTLVRRSSFFYSKPWGFDSENDFCNICASFRTSLAPIDLLLTTQSIERALGRKEKSNGTYHDRTIDIDIIRAFDDSGEEIKCEIPNPNSQISTLPELTIPHPLWAQRDFVKVPLQQIMH